MRAARGGDRLAFGALYDRYARVVHGIVLAHVPAGVADDLVQDVFERALRKIGKLREVDAFAGWLIAIARKESDPDLKRDIVRRLVEMHSPEASQFLEEILK